MNTQQPSLRARIRSAEWMARTEGGKHEDEQDKAARAEFESEAHLLPKNVQDALWLAVTPFRVG